MAGVPLPPKTITGIQPPAGGTSLLDLIWKMLPGLQGTDVPGLPGSPMPPMWGLPAGEASPPSMPEPVPVPPVPLPEPVPAPQPGQTAVAGAAPPIPRPRPDWFGGGQARDPLQEVLDFVKGRPVFEALSGVKEPAAPDVVKPSTPAAPRFADIQGNLMQILASALRPQSGATPQLPSLSRELGRFRG